MKKPPSMEDEENVKLGKAVDRESEEGKEKISLWTTFLLIGDYKNTAIYIG